MRYISNYTNTKVSGKQTYIYVTSLECNVFESITYYNKIKSISFLIQ